MIIDLEERRRPQVGTIKAQLNWQGLGRLEQRAYMLLTFAHDDAMRYGVTYEQHQRARFLWPRFIARHPQFISPICSAADEVSASWRQVHDGSPVESIEQPPHKGKPHAMTEKEIDRDNEQFNQGVLHTVDLLANALGVTDWHHADGSESYDDDLQRTLLNILIAKGLYSDETGAFGNLPS